MKIVGITACPTGIAHTYMAAEALTKAAQEMGHEIKIETQGVEVENILSDNDIQSADIVIIACQKTVDCECLVGTVPFICNFRCCGVCAECSNFFY